MHVVVLGAGVVGVTTAYYLAENGHKVTVVERADEVASGASGGNGGQLSYSFTDAMASPALLAKLPKVVASLDPAFRVCPPITSLPVRWGLSFLRQCSAHSSRTNTLALLQMALRSSSLMAELRSRIPLEFAFRKAGKLVLLNNQPDKDAAEKLCRVKRKYGCDVRVVDFEQAIDIEPALSHIQSPCVGAVYSADDEVGDALQFSKQLSQWLTKHRNVDFQFNTAVHRITTVKGNIASVETDSETLKPDALVVCLGAWSSRLLQPLGIRADVYPVRGYSVTLPPGDKPNSVSVSDLSNKMVYSRLGDRIRIAGFADIVGYSVHRDADRVRTLLETARGFAPEIADYNETSCSEWGGFRPVTPDSQPLVGPTRVNGLYLNTGHGMFGWTLACVTAYDVAEALENL